MSGALKLKREVAGSNRTRDRLAAYAAIAVVWYAQAIKDLLVLGSDLVQLVRSQDSFPKIRDRVLAQWRVQSMSQTWVDDALPRL
jgi:hypothetical protein